MNTKYSINQTTKALVFTGKPNLLNKDSVEKTDKEPCVSIHIPNSVETIGGGAFEDCTSLASVHIPNSVSTIDSLSFYGCAALASVHIPNSVSIIAHDAFWGCSFLASVHIPNTVKSVSGSTFWGCEALAYVHTPNSVSNIEDLAFCNCQRLHKACIPTNAKIDNIMWPSFNRQTSLLRPRLKPISSLSQKSALRALKVAYSVYL